MPRLALAPGTRLGVCDVTAQIGEGVSGGQYLHTAVPGTGNTEAGDHPRELSGVAQGKEIVYLDEYQGRDYIWSVPLAARGNDFHGGTPSPMFPVRLPATTFGDLNFLAVSRDGSRFFIPQAVEQPESDVIHVRMGWAK